MECVSADFGKDMSLKSNTQVCFDDFLVDEFLDFSNEDAFLEENPEPEIEEDEEEEENKDFSSSNSVSSEKNDNSNQSSDSSTKDDFWSVSSRDFEDLEWLSHFVSDPLHEYSPPLPGPVYVSPEPEMGISPIPSKPRTKRPRIINRFWSVGSHFFSNTSSSSITSSSSCSSPSSPLVLSHALPAKKPRKKPAVEGVTGVQSVRRCSHCGVQKTPQWRAGPMGSKTLCNACGVRFKSGRLFPEYRPACSPTFSNELHSNHHRKVLEMRRKKEGPGVA